MTISIKPHGGNLLAIAENYNIKLTDWLDLSTGIAPYAYPVPDIPSEVWQSLPQPSPGLNQAACQYYDCQQLLAVSGSQVVIQLLPKVLYKRPHQTGTSPRVWLPTIGYQEHRRAFCNYQSIDYSQLPSAASLQSGDIFVLINPNNPSGCLYSRAEVHRLYRALIDVGGLLIVDEAFMDCTPEQSMMPYSHQPNLVVLRSLGKFFGLAGIRLGFVAAAPNLLDEFRHQLGPWAVNHPAQYIGQHALSDTNWQHQQRLRLAEQRQALEALLLNRFDCRSSGTDLFQTIHVDNAPEVHQHLCQQGIYARLLDEQNGLRFGVPTQEQLLTLHKRLAKTYSQ